VAEFVHLADRLGQPSQKTGHSAPPVAVLRRLSETEKLPCKYSLIKASFLKDMAILEQRNIEKV
jgi:hypothetical protein